MTLAMAAFAAVQVAPTYAEAPIITPPGDIVIGDAEDGITNNNFVFPDALDRAAIATDDSFVDPLNLTWSYSASDAKYSINGVAALNLGTDDPVAPGAKALEGGDDIGPGTNDGNADTFTFRNEDLSPSGGSLPFGEPGTTGTLPAQTRAITLYASDGATAGQSTILVYTSNDTSDTISGGGVMTDIFDVVFDNPAAFAGWLSAVTGTGQTATSLDGLTGLCLNAGATGNNLIVWSYIAVAGYIELVDLAAYRLRTHVASAITTVGTTPLFDFAYENTFFDPNNGFAFLGGGNYGGEIVELDNEGGANSIGFPQGRDSFDLWLTPTGVRLPQWRGLIDLADSMYSPAGDAVNDILPRYRYLDFDVAGILAQNDLGTVCVQRIEASRGNVESLLNSGSQRSLPALNSAFWTPASTDTVQDLGQANSVSSINDGAGTASFRLASGFGSDTLGSRKTMFFYDPVLAGGFTQGELYSALYPNTWTADTLDLLQTPIVSDVAGGAEGTNPVDLISMIGTEGVTENLSVHLALKGVPGNFLRAGSPRQAATVSGETQYWMGAWYSHNVTLSGLINSQAWSHRLDIFNVAAIGGQSTADGKDRLLVESAPETWDIGNP
jgi:hypothetical protein